MVYGGARKGAADEVGSTQSWWEGVAQLSSALGKFWLSSPSGKGQSLLHTSRPPHPSPTFGGRTTTSAPDELNQQLPCLLTTGLTTRKGAQCAQIQALRSLKGAQTKLFTLGCWTPSDFIWSHKIHHHHRLHKVPTARSSLACEGTIAFRQSLWRKMVTAEAGQLTFNKSPTIVVAQVSSGFLVSNAKGLCKHAPRFCLA